MKKITILLFLFVLAVTTLLAQTKEITGTITGAEDEMPIPGVTVVVSGTSTGITTDLDGKYTLNVPEDAASLDFSFVGMKSQTIQIGASTVIDVVMESDLQAIGEVVVTALGISKEAKRIGYAIDKIDGKDMVNARNSNPINSLSGRIAGANITNSSGDVGGSSTIVLRGYTSVSGNNQPLFVVDGIPYDNGSTYVARRGYDLGESVDYGNAAADINPDDIESISVLKGASASALYGQRGGNGVILITTKSGKGTDGIGVNYSYDVGFKNPLVFPKFQNEYGQGYYDSGISDWGYNYYGDESWGPALDGDPDGNIVQPWSSSATWTPQPDNMKNFLRTGVTQTHNVSVNVGGKAGSTRFSYTRLHEDGMLENTELNKDQFNLNTILNVTDKLKVNAIAKYNVTDIPNTNGTSYTGRRGRNVFSNIIWSGRQVDFNHPDLVNYWADEGNRVQNNWCGDYWNNPYFMLYENTNKMQRNRFTGLVKVDYQLTENLSAFARIGTDHYNQQTREIFAMGSIFNTDGSSYQENYLFTETNADFLLTYAKDVSEEVSYSFSAGGSVMKQNTESSTVVVGGFVVPGLYSDDVTTAVGDENWTNWLSKKEIRSFYGMADVEVPYGVNIGLTFRRDYSSTLPVAERAYNYYSGNLAWVLTDGFELPAIDFAKLRMNYSQVGNDTKPYQLITAYNRYGTETMSIPGFSLSTIKKNSQLKPQLTKSIEFGVEVKLLKNRLGIDATYYDSKTENQIMEKDLSRATGFTSEILNVGIIGNKGIELVLDGGIIRNNDFNWDVKVIYSRNKSEVIELSDEEDEIVFSSWGARVVAKPGEEYGTIVGNDYARDINGNRLIGDDGMPTGVVTDTVIGHVQPKFTFGISNSFTYKNFDFNFLIDGKIGGDLFSIFHYYGIPAGQLEESLEGREDPVAGYVAEGVNVNTGLPNTVGVNTSNYWWNQTSYHTNWVIDGSYVKLRSASLGYTVKNDFLKKYNVQSLRLSVYGNNLLLLHSNAKHFDPEQSIGGGNNMGTFGMVWSATPAPRTIGFNVKVNL